MSSQHNKETLDTILSQAQSEIENIFQNITQKEKNPPANSENLSLVLYYFENIQNVSKSYQEIFQIKQEIIGVFRGFELGNDADVEINEKKTSFENFINETIQKISAYNIIKSISSETKQYVALIKENIKQFDAFKQNKDQLSKENSLKAKIDALEKENSHLKTEVKSLKDKTEELNKENSGMKTNLTKKDENLLHNLIKNEDKLLEKHDEILLKRKKRQLAEAFALERQALLEKIQQLENENLQLYSDNIILKSLEKIYIDIKEKLPNYLKKIVPYIAKIVKKEKDKIEQRYLEVNKKVERIIEKHEKLQRKFEIYKENYIKYYHVYHSGNILNVCKEFFTSYNNNIDKKIIFEKLKEGDMGIISIQFPEFYKYIDRKFLEEKIQILLDNIMKLNQFAKIFLKILIDIFPNPSSTDKETLYINGQTHEIIDSLQRLDNKMNTETEKIRQNLFIIYNGPEDESKNLVEIFEKCFEFESDCVNHILSLDRKYQKLGKDLSTYLKNYY